jgi:hypothetical protein
VDRHWGLLDGNGARAGGEPGTEIAGDYWCSTSKSRLIGGLPGDTGGGVFSGGSTWIVVSLFYLYEGVCLQQEVVTDISQESSSGNKGSWCKMEAPEKDGQSLGEGRPMAKVSAVSWTPPFSSDLFIQQEDLKFDSKRDFI